MCEADALCRGGIGALQYVRVRALLTVLAAALIFATGATGRLVQSTVIAGDQEPYG